MSKIDKLSILGVRSFDNTRSETIQFHSPLTLIVGLNGSGKTTIIECLKFVTTGMLPPNSTGGAFVHDPKLCGEKEVLAQVKVSFRSTEGTRMVCTRNLQLTVKKTARSMSQLEGSLLIVRDGEKLTMSSRVAELNTMMPQYLGVSTAIIDSVIFCHQEESLWPLAEPAKLKQRFDQIFEALKYTRAIENIKVLQKNQKQALIGFKKDEEYLKAEKDRGDKMEKRSLELSAEIEVLRDQSDEKSAQIKEAAKEAEKAWRKAETAGMIVGELSGKRIEARTKEESVQSLRQTLNEMSDSDEDLQRMLEQYEERVQVYEENLSSFKTRWQDLNQEIQQGRNNVMVKERECGSYEAQKESYERQVENRGQLIKETARGHNIRGFDYDIDDTQVQEFMDRITKMAKEQNAAFERARKETQDELSAAQKTLNSINEQKSVLSQRKENSRQTIAAHDLKIGNLQNDFNKIDVDEGRMGTLQSQLQDRTARLSQKKTNMGTAGSQSNIERDETDLHRLEQRKEKLELELEESTHKLAESSRLDMLRDDMAKNKAELSTMMGAHGDKISSIVGSGWDQTSVGLTFQRALDQSNAQLSEAEKQRDGSVREKDQIEYQLRTCKADLNDKRKALSVAQKAIKAAVDVDPAEYLEELEALENSHNTMKKDEDSFVVINEYFDQCINNARSGHVCRTCTRQLKVSEVDVLVKNIEKLKKQVSTDPKTEAEFKDIQKDLTNAQNVRSIYEDWVRLKEKEIPSLEQEEKTLSAKRAELVTQLEAHDSSVSEKRDATRGIQSHSRTVETIVAHNATIVKLESQISELTERSQAAGSSRGLEPIRLDIKKINDETKTIRARLANTISERDRNVAQISSLELEIKDIQGKITTAQYQLKERRSYETQIEEYKSLNIERRENIKSVDVELQSLAKQLSQAQLKYDDIARRGAETDRELQGATNKLNSSLNQLKLADQEISAYHAKGGPQQLARGRREVEACKEQVALLESDQSSLVREIKGLEDQLRNHGETKRSIADNQRYRRDLRQLNSVRLEIRELEKHNAEEDKAIWEREGSRWQMQRNSLAAEQATIVGSLKSKDAQLKQNMDDWETDFRDAGKKYKEAHIKVETTKACIEDLGRYSGALDKAIMKYHSIKMEEINRIIDELWRKTYQGTDVDTILIRSENENAKSNKSYNYRVCMVKQDAEMDMRGRCSAGQKVLASIIIRLALAECFGTSCGLIALDEPTTNLDRDNIRALAQSLAEIIRMRRAQPNFQLIVITHDEEFLRYMNCSDFADVYWRVGRNDKQKSQIERQSIAEVI